jgi:MFS family permease
MPNIAYFKFISTNRRFIAFGLLMTFASSFGQTYFIGILGPSIQAEFSLSHTVWGTVYMIGTLASAVLLPWTGKQIDRVDLKIYTILVCLSLILACAFVSLVNSVAVLVFAIFLLRQSGQGLMSHVAITSMARYFNTGRGRAIALASLGFSAGEALLPFMAVLAIAVVGWRWIYGGTAALLLVGLIPTVFWLLKGHNERHRIYLERLASPVAFKGIYGRSWTRAQVLHDLRFYLLLPGLLAPSMILTAMFFHHLSLADAKGWTHAWITGSYGIYAAATILTSLVSGLAIDRIGAARLVPFMLVPLMLAMVVVAKFVTPWTAWLYLILAGINVGVVHTAASAFWVEIYGAQYLGAIRSMISSLGVLSSALGPVIMGSLMDMGVSIENVCLLFAGYTVVGAALIILAFTIQPISAKT